MTWRFDADFLARMIAARRRVTKATLRDAAKQTGVAPATLMRMEQGKRADIDSVVKVCGWLCIAVDGFVEKGKLK